MTKFNKMLQVSTLAIALTAALASLTGVAYAEDTLAQSIVDVRQESHIWAAYALSPYLRANDLRIQVKSGKATVSGVVDEEVNKELATQIALGVEGIKEVDNQVVIKADYVPSAQSSARNYGDAIDDASITAIVKSKLLWSKFATGLAIQVETKAGKVTLKGTAESKLVKDTAYSLALNTRGVVAVDNQLVIKAEPVPSVVGSAGQVLSDTWIATKVKSTLLYSSNVNGSAVAVTTTNGVVSLAGKVSSGAERALAIELTQNVRGVTQVDATQLTH